MSEPPSKKPRIRSKIFSLSEQEILKDEMKLHLETINAKHCNGSSTVTKKQQDKCWAVITEKVNAVGICKRSVFEIKEKWRNLTKKAKAEVSKNNLEMKKTGGGPPPEINDPMLSDIASLYSNSAAFHGIPGAMDAESIIFSLADVVGDIHGDVPAAGDHEVPIDFLDDQLIPYKSCSALQQQPLNAGVPKKSTTSEGSNSTPQPALKDPVQPTKPALKDPVQPTPELANTDKGSNKTSQPQLNNPVQTAPEVANTDKEKGRNAQADDKKLSQRKRGKRALRSYRKNSTYPRQHTTKLQLLHRHQRRNFMTPFQDPLQSLTLYLTT